MDLMLLNLEYIKTLKRKKWRVMTELISIIMTCILFFSTVSFSREVVEYDSSAVDIVPLRKVIREGEILEILLILPKADSAQVNWSVFLNRAKKPMFSGNLENEIIIKNLELPGLKQGVYSLVLFIWNEQGKPVKINTVDIEVKKKSSNFFTDQVVGIFSGVLIAILIFIVQDIIKNCRDSKKRKNDLSLKLIHVLNEQKHWDGSQGNVPELPEWIVTPGEVHWSPLFVQEPFKTIIRELKEAHLDAKIGILDLQKYVKKLEGIVNKLK